MTDPKERSLATRAKKLASLGTIAIVIAVLGAWIFVALHARGHIVSLDEAPTAEVVIVPGARVYQDGRPSLALRNRLDAAAALYNEGKAEHILVSGDNRLTRYNEPAAMQRYLRNLNIPQADITLDYAGFDTWDTCIRAKEQFGVDQAIVVTQPRFAQRTAALCQSATVSADVPFSESVWSYGPYSLATNIAHLHPSLALVGFDACSIWR